MKLKLVVKYVFVILFSTLCLYAKHPIKLELNWKHQFQFAGFYAAKEKGFYDEVGLDVEILEWRPKKERINALLDNKINFAIFASEIIGYQLKGTPLVLVGNYFKRIPVAFATKTNIHFPKDLQNKKLMAIKEDITSAIFHQMWESANISPNDINIIPPTFSLKEFIKGDVDAVQIYITDQLYELLDKKIPHNLININNYGIEFYDIITTTSKKFANENPQIVKDFHNASIKGWRYALEHKEEIVDVILEKYNSQDKSKKALLFEASQVPNVMLPSIYPIGSIQKEKILRIADIYKRKEDIDTKYDTKQFLFDNQNNSSSQLTLTKEETKFINKNEPITFCPHTKWEPYERYPKDGKHEGIFAQIHKKIWERTGLNIKLVYSDTFHEMEQNIKEGKCDIVSALIEKNDRLATHRFTSKALYNMDFMIIAKDNFPFIGTLEGMYGKTLAVVKGADHGKYIQTNYPKIKLLFVNKPEDEINAVLQNKADAFISPLGIISYTATKMNISNLKVVGNSGINWDLKIAINKEKPLLYSIYDKGLLSMTSSEINAIKNQWFSIKYTNEIDKRLIIKIILSIITLFTLILIWNRKLSNERTNTKKALKRLKNTQHELKILAQTDKLTSLYNRHKIDDILKKVINSVQEENSNYCIILIDIDYFKRVNDNFGHNVGDYVLCEFAKILKTNVRESDIIGRWGGEEFLIILNSNLNGAKILANNLKIIIQEYNFAHNVEHKTASFGVTQLKKTDKIDTAIIRVDKALYEAKENGRNCIKSK